MAVYPGAIPSFTGFTSSHTLAADNHAAQHNLEQSEIVAIATKIGTGASTPTSSTFLKGSSAGVSSWAQVTLTSDVTGILPVANGGTGQSNLNNLTLGTPTLTTPTIASFVNAVHDHTNSAGGGQLGFNALLSTIFSGQIQSFSNPGTGGGTIKYINLGGIKIGWGTGMISNSAAWLTIDWTTIGYTTIPIITANSINQGSASGGWVEFTSKSSGGSGSVELNGCSFLTRIANAVNSNATTINFMIIGT